MAKKKPAKKKIQYATIRVASLAKLRKDLREARKKIQAADDNLLTPFAAGLYPSGFYDVATALRGPDAKGRGGGSTVKAVVTARLRAIFFKHASACYGDVEFRALDQEELGTLKANLDAWRNGDPPRDEMRHSLHHLQKAIIATSEHEIWGGLADDLLNTLYGLSEVARTRSR